MRSILQAENVSKRIKGKQILTQVSLSLEEGNVYGLTGENGAGKTMLLKILCGLVKPTSGTIIYRGRCLQKEMEILPSVGIMLENAGLYPEWSALKNLTWLASVRKQVGESEIRTALERTGINPSDKKQFNKYSLGNRQRILLAQAIMEKPEVLLLDEPINALDDKGVELFKHIIRQECDRGAIVLIASHQMKILSDITGKVFRLENGRIHNDE